MACLEKPVFEAFDAEQLYHLQIRPPFENVRKQVLHNWDLVAKPLDGMGRFEKLTAQIGAITGSSQLSIRKKAVIILCADNGIVEEQISQSGQDVTTAVAKAMTTKASSVGKMAQCAGVDTIPVDIGIAQAEPIPGLLYKKIRCGTRNFRKEPAMTQAETLKAIATGIELVASCKEKGYELLATGELGIGNTTTSSAVAAALLHCEAANVTGRGAGLSDEGLRRKQQVITEAIEKYDLYQKDALTVLSAVGGLDIAGLAGVCIGGALYRMPILLDGVISMVAALAADRILPGTKAFLLPSHKGKEPAVELLMQELEMTPVIEAELALGEGTGAVMMMSLLDVALSVYSDSTTFADMQIEQYSRFQDLSGNEGITC